MKRTDLPVIPASLLVVGRPCLVVGGGRVALGKIKHLIGGEAKVTVVDPDAGEEVEKIARDGLVSLHRCAFDPEILDSAPFALVYAATSSSDVNRSVVELCNERGILCCAVDANWSAGDFVTPAVIRGDSVTVSVSTGGASCRRSRVVKDLLSRQIKALEGADLLILGTSHQELSLARREPFHLAGERLEDFGAFLKQLRGIQEFMILNTCNRVELIAVARRDENLLSLIKKWLGYDALKEGDYFCHWGWDTFAHLNLLTAGLLSQTPGENHIVAQFKEAYQASESFGWSRLILKQWSDTTLHVSRHFRQASSPYLRHVELEDLCVEYLEKMDSRIGEALVVGTGMIGAGLVQRFREKGKKVRWFFHQNRPELTPEEEEWISIYSMAELLDHLPEAEALFCATGSSEYVVSAEMAEYFSKSRDSWLVDLSLPRNIDPALDRGPVHVIDLDDLKHWYRREAADWDKINGECKKLLEEHRQDYVKIISSFTNRSEEQ